MSAELTASAQKRKQVLNRLESPIKNRDDLLRLFVNTLGYQRVERPIPITKETFGEGIALDLAQTCRPIQLANAGSFHVIYTELDGDRLDYWRQRVLATKLLETFQDSLFVFARAGTVGDARGAEAHLVNVKTTDRNGRVVALKAVEDKDELMMITAKGIIIRTGLEEVRAIGRNTQGVRLIKLDEGDKLVAVARITPEESEAGLETAEGNGNNAAASADVEPSEDAEGGQEAEGSENGETSQEE